eukprot:7158015-Heterocapsa_arctica.AAC.1
MEVRAVRGRRAVLGIHEADRQQGGGRGRPVGWLCHSGGWYNQAEEGKGRVHDPNQVRRVEDEDQGHGQPVGIRPVEEPAASDLQGLRPAHVVGLRGLAPRGGGVREHGEGSA